MPEFVGTAEDLGAPEDFPAEEVVLVGVVYANGRLVGTLTAKEEPAPLLEL